MRPEALTAWTNLYAAVGLLAGICGVCAAIKTFYDIKTGAHRLETDGTANILRLIPKIYLRWNLNYLSGTPAILAVAIAYACYIGLPAFNPR